MQHSLPSSPSSPFPRPADDHEDSIFNPANVLAYLCWLQQFYNVKMKQRDSDVMYLAIAEQRYTLWLDKLHEKGYWREGHKVPVPPTDVLLIWHAHMISPWKYYEDIARLYGIESPLLHEDFPLHMVSTSSDIPSSSTITFHGNDEVLWNTVVTKDKDLKDITIECPWCANKCTFSSYKYIAFLKGDIIDPMECSQCHAKFTIDNLSAKRFVKDLERALNDEPFYLGGTILDYQTGRVDSRQAKRILRFLFPHQTNETRWLVRLGSASDTCHWEAILDVFHSIESDLQKKDWIVDALKRIRKSYQDIICPYSLDLVEAVQRHRQFTEKVINPTPAWCNARTLDNAIYRYLAFLRLLNENPSKLLVTTLDIELVRHTHMLFPHHYREYTYDLFHRVVIHDDTVPDGMRKESYRVTTSLWEQFFQVAYAPSKPDSLNTDEVELDMPKLQKVSSFVPSTDVEEEKKKGALSRLMSIFQS
ncbi:hypothetical protein BC937DRAFT_89246 [Endogone sp. FLAS-F59071]|nr:hypothetical protein BC937DRAFT_89246 [Endogone sp. FLAS-F59071]|eukprot:RUS22430.1 hypothetical protein BC937DRAFT_89246 [Endogone sp. FLAS-F59071]